MAQNPQYLIRSATTLLSIIDQQVEQPRQSSDLRSVRFLDRIALLFVTKPKEDVSAVSAVLTGSGSILVGCTDSTDDADNDNDHPMDDTVDDAASETSDHGRDDITCDTAEVLLVAKNSSKVKNSAATGRGLETENVEVVADDTSTSQSAIWDPSINQSFSTARIGDDWLKKCCRKRGPMGSAEHALQLQFMLRQLHPKSESGGDADTDLDHVSTAANNFIRFIYFQCFPKIQQRLCLPVKPGGLPFKDLFCAGQIKPAELRSRFDKSAADDVVLDPKILLHGDEWIDEYWKACLNGKKPVLEACDDRTYLVYNEEMAVGLHNVISHMFKLLSEDLERVRFARLVHTTTECVSAEYLQSVEAALDGVDYYMVFLASLLQSPCFWKHLRHPAVRDWVLNQASTKQDKTGEEYDTDNEEVTELQDHVADDPAAAVTRWLRCATQWSVALSEIIEPSSRVHQILLAKDVQILSVHVPSVENPRKQAPLNEILELVVGGTGIHLADAVAFLQGMADRNGHPSEESNDGANGWHRLSVRQWDQWPSTFTGKYHCESVLASLLEMKTENNQLVAIANRAKKAIGVSKRCCFCCTLYLHQLNPDLMFGATSGKAYPWALPAWDNRLDVGHIILGRLVETLRDRLVRMVPPAIQHRDSGSDSGRSASGKRKRVPKYTRKQPVNFQASEDQASE